MKEGRYFLGLDVGTQGTKALVCDVVETRIIGRGSATYGLLPAKEPNAAEQHPETWIEAVRQATAAAMRSSDLGADAISCIGVSGQQHGLVVLDDEDRVLAPARLWCDTTAAAEADEISKLAGRRTPAGFTAPKILRMIRREPDLWRRVRSILLPHDYVNFRLTGSKLMEAGDASGTGLFDPIARTFDPKLIDALDRQVADRLPPLVNAGAAAARLDAAGAALLGLREGVLVSTGSGDNMMSAIGAGAVRPGVVVMSLGTSGTIFTCSDHAVVDPSGAVAPFCDATGRWLPLICITNMTGVLEEVRQAFGTDLETLTTLASTEPAGSRGLLFLPYLQGERVPDLPNASGSLIGIRPGLMRHGLVFRAALEGTALLLANGAEKLRASGITIDEVRLVGGGARNQLWREIIASAIGARVVTMKEAESGALGAALHAAWTHRRNDDESARITDVAEPFAVTSDEPALPDTRAREVYATTRRHLEEMTARLHASR